MFFAPFVFIILLADVGLGQDMLGCPNGPEPVPLPLDVIPPDLDAKLKEYANALKGAPSLSVGFVYDQELIWFYGTNFDHKELPVPTKDTAYNIGSVNKIFDALVVYMQRDAGLLSLDAEIPELKNLPKFSPSARGITWRHLTTHRAGLQRECPCGSSAGLCNITTQEVLELLPSLPPVAPINARPSYSNLGFALAANMAAELSGVTFPEFVKENVFKKLGMTHSGFVGEEPKPPSYLMPGYENGAPMDYWVDFGWDRHAYTSASDFQKIISLIFRDRTPLGARPDQIIDSVTAREWLNPAWAGSGPAPVSAFGGPWEFRWQGESNHWFLGKRGSVYGYTTQVVLIPEIKFGLVISVNRAVFFPVSDLAIKMLELVIPFLEEQFAARAPPPPPPALDLIGYYEGVTEPLPLPPNLLYSNVTIHKESDAHGNIVLYLRSEIIGTGAPFKLSSGYLLYSGKYSSPAKDYFFIAEKPGGPCGQLAGGSNQWLVRDKQTGTLNLDGEWYGFVYHKKW